MMSFSMPSTTRSSSRRFPQEEAVDTIILNRSALSFGPDNSAYVLMYDENQVMQQVPVEIGVDNDNYVQITAGLNVGDTVYKEVQENVSAASGLMSLFSSMGGGMQQQTGMQQGGMPGGFDGGNMPDFGSRPGGSGGGFGGGGGMPGGFGGGMPGR